MIYLSRRPKPHDIKVRTLGVTLQNKDIDKLAEKGKPNKVAREIIEEYLKKEKEGND